jgi:hypothetical protein
MLESGGYLFAIARNGDISRGAKKQRVKPNRKRIYGG